MFAYIKGNLAMRSTDYVVIDVNGIGYKIYTAVGEIAPGLQHIQLYTHLHVRENEMTLFGFPHQDLLQLFELLITVSGIGPKVALNMLNHINSPDLIAAILYDDEKALTQLPGIGKKTAKRIILDLKEKISKHNFTASVPIDGPQQITLNSATEEAIAALLTLGYDLVDARKAAEKALAVEPEGNVTQLLKLALRSLSKL